MKHGEATLRPPGNRLSLRTTIAVLAAVGLLAAGIVLTRQDGLPKTDIVTKRGGHWLVYRPGGSAVLADAVTGQLLVRIDAERDDAELDAVQGGGQAYLLDRTSGEVLTIDQQAVRLDASRPVPDLLSGKRVVTGVGPDGAVAVPLGETTGLLIPQSGQIRPLDLTVGADDAVIDASGQIWMLYPNGTVERIGGSSPTTFPGVVEVGPGLITTVGDSAVVLDQGAGLVTWLPEGASVELGAADRAIDSILQEPSPFGTCVWVGLVTELACVSPTAVEQRRSLGGLTLSATDRLAAVDDIAGLLRANGNVQRIDLTSGASAPVDFTTSDPTVLTIASSEVGVWIDDPYGPRAVSLTSDTTHLIDKLDADVPVFGADGEPLESDETIVGDRVGGARPAADLDPPEPDEDGQDEAPTAEPDFVSAREGDVITINATANDFDPDGDPIVITSVQRSNHGETKIDDATTVSFTPGTGEVGRQAFEYTIMDPAGHEATAQIEVDIIPFDSPNAPPQGTADHESTRSGRPVRIDVLRNDIDPDQDPLRIANFLPPPESQGVVQNAQTAEGRSALEFTPSANFPGGTVTFQYTVQDLENPPSEPISVSVDVAPPGAPNRPPAAQPDAERTRAGVAVSIPLTLNDDDPDNDLLVVESIRMLTERAGQVSENGAALNYTPPPTAPPIVLFEYTVDDQAGGRDTARAMIQIIPEATENGVPTAVPDEYTTTGPTTFNPTANDTDPDNNPLSVVSFTQPENGNVQFAGANLQFIPVSGFVGDTTFDYTISDGQAEATGRVTIRVTAQALPDPPTANDDVATTNQDKPVVIDVLSNDRDSQGGRPTLDGRPNCQAGTCEITSENTIKYTPPPGQTGTFPFSYTVRDRAGRTDGARVAVRVLPAAAVNQQPTAANDTAEMTAGESTEIDVLQNDSDPDDDTLRIVAVGSPSHGDAVISGTSIRYNAPIDFAGSVAFAYTITDPGGLISSASVNVRVTARPPAHEPPIAIADLRSMVISDPPLTVNVVENDVDPDGDESALRITSFSAEGDATVTQVGSASIRVAPRSEGTVKVTYTIADADNQTAQSTLTVAVSAPPNAPPVATNDSRTIGQGTVEVVVPVLINDSDPDGDPLVVRIVSPPSSSVATVDTTSDEKSIIVRPSPDTVNTFTVGYQAEDPTGKRSATATLTVDITPCADEVPSAPNVVDFTPYNTAKDLALLAPSQASFALSTSNVVGGSTTMLGGGNVRFTPAAGNNGTGSFQYTVTNPCNVSRSGSVTIDVNRNPVVGGGPFSVTAGQVLVLNAAQVASDDEPVTITSVAASAGSAAPISGGTQLQFTPPVTSGPVTLTISVADPGNLTASGGVTVNVSVIVNNPPSAANDSQMIPPGNATQIGVLGNDSDDHPTSELTVQIIGATAGVSGGGTVTAAPSGDGRDVVVTASAGAHGTAQLSYRAIDAQGAGSNIATINITVNRPPTDVSQSISIPAGGFAQLLDVLATPPDPDGDFVSTTNLRSSSPAVTATFFGPGDLQITVEPGTPAGTAQVLFDVRDQFGSLGTGTINVTIT
jgi:large repetitive protein